MNLELTGELPNSISWVCWVQQPECGEWKVRMWMTIQQMTLGKVITIGKEELAKAH